MDSLTAIHVNWTLPSDSRSANGYHAEDFELLSTILSALLWRRNNGAIKLYTDNRGFEYYKSKNLLDLWDNGIDTQTLESIPNNISPSIYWAAGKFFAMRKEKEPVALIDTDLLIWKKISKEVKKNEVVSFHRESVLTDCYLPYDKLKKRDSYRLDTKWDWSENPCNTAFLFIKDNNFKNYYTNSAIDFMSDNNETPNDYVSQMVFAEQRLLAMCAKKKGKHIDTLLPRLYDGESMDYSHLWGAKQVARANDEFHKQLNQSLFNAIEREFPSYKIPSAVTNNIMI